MPEAIARLEEEKHLPKCEISGHPGHVPREDMVIYNGTKKNLLCKNRRPTTEDRIQYWVELQTGEMTDEEVIKSLTASCVGGNSTGILGPWDKRMPGRVYAWSADFHPAPGSCNFPVYRDIGVTLHLECDTKPNCEAAGVCRKRMKDVFAIGFQATGYALDPKPPETIKKFYKAYKDDPEMNRVDVFMCSHPAANCELFEPFITEANSTKSMVMFPTTRLEFGRNDPYVTWRMREIKLWGTFASLPERWRNTVNFIHRYSSSDNVTGRKRLWLAVNNMYDAAYVHYFTGIRPTYIPSWCGDEDQSFGYQKKWSTCSLWSYDGTNNTYAPKYDVALFVPHRNMQWAGVGAGEGDMNHPLYKELHAAQKQFHKKEKRGPPKIHHSHDVMTNHAPYFYKKYKAVVWLPYQSSVMSFFELYRLNIPMFAPSVDLLKRWHWSVDIMSDRIYGLPDMILGDIQKFVDKHGGVDPEDVQYHVPTPNKQHEIPTLDYWFPYGDVYVFDHVQHFDNFTHLLYLMDSANLTQISRDMAEFNSLQRQSIMLKWHDVFKEAVPHVDRSNFIRKYGIHEKVVRDWTEKQDKEIERRITRLQGNINYCNVFFNCTGALGTVNSYVEKSKEKEKEKRERRKLLRRQ